MIQVFNGITNSTLYKGLDDELSPTSVQYLLNETHTNGMQFIPTVYNNNEQLEDLNVFDPYLLRFLSYTKSQTVVNEGSGVQVVQYDMSEEFSGQSVSMAFE